MPTAKDVLKIARKELGTFESPPYSNRTKYGEWYRLQGQPWCAMFVSWVLDQAGIEGYKHAYTPSGVAMFQELDQWHDKGKPGDLAYFDFPDSTYRVQHVGIVVENLNNGYYRCIEGNTSGTNTGSQDNGGGVYERTRPRSYIVGFGRPTYRKDFDYLLKINKKVRRFERLKIAMQVATAKLDKGIKVVLRRTK